MEKITDFISGINVPATPEEVNATQPISKILFEDYGYPKDKIITRPQYRVKQSPSDKKGYPVDIAVFDEKYSQGSCPKIIVECKAPDKAIKDTRQLQIYMSLSGAEFGIMYNGHESIYLHRSRTQSEGDLFETIPCIPKYHEKLDEIGVYKKSHLQKTHNLKNIFREIRGWIVANGNVTRDEDIASQMILLILCKIYDERFTAPEDNIRFRTSPSDSDDDVSRRIQDLFTATRAKYCDVIAETDDIHFDGQTLKGIIGRLQKFSIINTDRDSIADAFEIFVGKSVKEKEGQFFTPRNVIRMMIAAIDLKKNSYIIDSACGSGGFLIESLKKIEEIVGKEAVKYGWNESAKNDEVKEQAVKYIRGIEKDPFLTKLAKSYMAILGDGKGGIFREDSLELPSKWGPVAQQIIKPGTFDFLLANPPFGKNIKVEGEEKLAQYSLAVSIDKKGRKIISKSGNVSSLFLERNLQLLKPAVSRDIRGGKMAIILPEPYFALDSYSREIDLMIKGNNIQWVIDLPQNTFRPHNNAKCCAIVIQKDAPQQEFIYMAVAEYIGHDHQGKPIYTPNGELKDDSAQIIREITERQQNNGLLVSEFKNPHTFRISAEEVLSRRILIPRFYWQDKLRYIEDEAAANGFDLVPVKDLIEKKVITFFAGNGSPAGENKGQGEIPYIRVKDIVNWQIYVDVTSLIPEEEYERLYNPAKELRPKDILYVSRGSYRIGSVAIVSPFDGKMILTREIIVLRVNEDNEYGITPEYLLYALSHKYTWEQSKNKIFYEPCLPNIGSRWQELKIPVPKDPKVFEQLKADLAETIIGKQWGFRQDIAGLKTKYGAYLV